MFIVLLKFTENKSQAGQFMEGHNEWVNRGFDDGAFLVVGSLQPNKGGAILCQSESREALESRVREDPFVAEQIVSVEILEITPAKADERLKFLLE